MNLGLRHGDRLQVSEAVPDPLTISQSVRFQNQQEVELRFFRASKQHPLRFVSDWGMVPGWALPDRLRLDVLHIVDGGITSRFIGTVMWRALRSGIWGLDNKDELQTTFSHLREDMLKWYETHMVNNQSRLSRSFKLT